MEELLIKVLEEATGLQVYNLERPEAVRECIVYTYSDDVFSTADDEEDIIKYVLFINLYCDAGLNRRKREIKEALEKNGFLKMYIPPANLTDELGLINQAFNYTYIEAR